MKTTNRKKNMRLLFANKKGILPERSCPNCGGYLHGFEGHFVPPSMGDKGFYICDAPQYSNPICNGGVG